MINAAQQSCFRHTDAVNARSARTENVHVEFLRCESPATVHWNVNRPEVSLMWVRDKDSNAQITMAGRQPNVIAPGRANFWFFPEGVGAEGELTGKGAFDCAGVFVDPAFLSDAARRSLAAPMNGFSDDGLGRAFDELARELTEPDDMLPLFTEGWAMRALAFVARASRDPRPASPRAGGGLAPWQLRRAKEMLQRDLSGNISLEAVAEACKVSVGHFSRAFKNSTGVPPHRWIVSTRLRTARDLLANSDTPLVHVAGICGFADQSHFSRSFASLMGTSPGAWRRANREYKGEVTEGVAG